MQHQHPDDRFALTDRERDEFHQICNGLTGSGPDLPRNEEPGAAHAGYSATAIICTLFVFIGLAANSVFVVLVAAGGAVAALMAARRR